MPIAPPRLRIRLNSPDACLSRFGASAPSDSVTVGGTASCWPMPRSACGSSSSRADQSCVIGRYSIIDTANSASPAIRIQRRSKRLASVAYSGMDRIWNTPVENTARPICSAL